MTRDLRNNSGREHVALEHFAVTAKRCNSLLDARSARIEEADDRRPGSHCQILDFRDFLRVRLRERTSEYGEILGKGKNGTAVHRTPSGNNAVAWDLALVHAELGRTVLDKHVELLERALVHEQLQALSRRQLSPLVLGFDARLSSAGTRARAAVFELLQHLLHAPLSFSSPNCIARSLM